MEVYVCGDGCLEDGQREDMNNLGKKVFHKAAAIPSLRFCYSLVGENGIRIRSIDSSEEDVKLTRRS